MVRPQRLTCSNKTAQPRLNEIHKSFLHNGGRKGHTDHTRTFWPGISEPNHNQMLLFEDRVRGKGIRWPQLRWPGALLHLKSLARGLSHSESPRPWTVLGAPRPSPAALPLCPCHPAHPQDIPGFQSVQAATPRWWQNRVNEPEQGPCERGCSPP